METDPTPPPYENDTEITSNDKSTQVAPAITESEPGPGSEQVEAEEEEPHVVVYVSLRNDKSGKSPNKFRSSREAIMLSPSSTYKKLSRLLDKRLSNHKYLLHLPEDDELRTILYYTIQDGGRDPWLDSNWHNNVRIFDEQSWKGCKALMARNEKSILMMIVTTVDDAKDVSNEDEKDDKKSSKAKRKSCAVQ